MSDMKLTWFDKVLKKIGLCRLSQANTEIANLRAVGWMDNSGWYEARGMLTLEQHKKNDDFSTWHPHYAVFGNDQHHKFKSSNEKEQKRYEELFQCFLKREWRLK